MTPLDVLSLVLCIAGAGFFVAGTAGLLRFPDVYTRLHALTKADNLGLGLMALGLILRAESPAAMLKLAAIWLLVLAASSSAGYLVANAARRQGIRPWRRQ
jgi:multicomponent Na+:H+ antiporter subunit G